MGLAVPVLVEAASPAAVAADTVDNRTAASAEVVADKEAAVVELQDGRGERSEQEQRELKKGKDVSLLTLYHL